jgi:hypothetical protein
MIELTEQDWKNISIRFWKKVDIVDCLDSCWEWKRGKDKDGYGHFSILGTGYGSHRIAYQLHNKIIIVSSSICVLHKCDNPPCCNPHHLWLGRQLDNAIDMMNKGRFTFYYGKYNGGAKYTHAQIKLIRRLWITGNYTLVELGELVGISKSQVFNIVHQKQRKDS